MTFRLPHLVAAVLLHIALVTLLVGGVQCTAKPQRAPVISGVLLDPSRQQVAEQKKREQQRRAEAERKRLDEARQKKLAEERKQQEAEQKRKAAATAAQKKKADEALRQKQLADQRKAADQKKVADQKKAAEQKKSEDAARLKKEQDAQREREAAAKREAAEQAQLDEAMRAEEAQRELAREDQARAASEREVKQEAWVHDMQVAIQRKWRRFQEGDLQCTIKLSLLPDGTVTQVKVVQGSGNAAFDQSVEEAVLRASPLPTPADRSVFDRELTITFSPQ